MDPEALGRVALPVMLVAFVATLLVWPVRRLRCETGARAITLHREHAPGQRVGALAFLGVQAGSSCAAWISRSGRRSLRSYETQRFPSSRPWPHWGGRRDSNPHHRGHDPAFCRLNYGRHRPSKLVAGSGVEPASRVLQARALPLELPSPGDVDGTGGLEPPPADPEPAALPVALRPRRTGRDGRIRTDDLFLPKEVLSPG